MSKYNCLGMETLNVTQNYLGGTSHKPHTTGTPKDYPIDLAGADSGQSAFFAMVDMKVTAIRGVGNPATNTIWLVSTEKVECPKFEDIFFVALTHWNDGSKTAKYEVGDIIKAGEVIAYEGTDGATHNHLHLSCGRGYSDNWTKSTTGKWVVTGDTMPPEDVFYIDRNFTKEKWGGFITWIDKPTEEQSIDSKQVEELKQQVSSLKEQMSSKDKEILEMKTVIESQDFTIQDYASKIGEKDLEIKDLRKRLNEVSVSQGTLIFGAPETAKYQIVLKEKEKLYIKS